MPKSRQEFEKQHENDVLKIQELNLTINAQAEEISLLNEKMNDANYLVSLLVNELRRISQPNFTPETHETRPGRNLKLTPNLTRVIKMLHDEGQSQRQIADTLGMSVGLVNKACKFPSQPEA